MTSTAGTALQDSEYFLTRLLNIATEEIKIKIKLMERGTAPRVRGLSVSIMFSKYKPVTDPRIGE